VRTVIIDGRVVMKDRVLLTVDLASMKERVSRQYGILMERFERAIA
jgi:5-methylthioadenosine/S-adenosylhomocysteine deaminase